MAQAWAKISEIPDSKLTPMLRQFISAKAESGDSLLFFRMGDFFELFFDDALDAADLLGLTLTSRDGAGKERRIPMAGVPFRSVNTYIAKAIEAGRTVAICDQVEDPKESKGIVKREVVRTITRGTVLAPELLEDRDNNYLAAIACRNGSAGLAFVDVTTGEFLAAQIEADTEQTICDELTRMNPAEVLVAESLDEALAARLRAQFQSLSFAQCADHEFDTAYGKDLIMATFDLASLKGLDLEDAPDAIACAGAVLGYVQRTQRDTVPHMRHPRRYSPSGYVVLDGNTQRNLELVESLADRRRQNTLLHILDRTRTPMGARRLRQWILHPLVEVSAIRHRLDAVESLVENVELRLGLQEALKPITDIERLLGRITSKTGNARDLQALGKSLLEVPALRRAIADTGSARFAQLHTEMDELTDVTQWIESALLDDLPIAIMEGDLFQSDYTDDLRHVRELVSGGRDWIATLQKSESERTGIPKLKVGYNKVFGYYIEVSRANADRIPAEYERKQTLVNAERFITPALKEREEEIVNAQERMQRLEYNLFVELRDRVAAEAQRIHDTAAAIAEIDTLLSLADVAVARDYTKPQVDDGTEIHVRDGRHPVVEALMKPGEFVPNDITLDPDSAGLLIMTGPNMAGKSTYLRQVALITLMAQVGSYVPAAEARIGVVDRIFTRVGASDNLVRGESTFMVEMTETAAILNAATDRSLLVLDEIGRGTSTFDGISIAWSVAEHIHDHIGAKTLFATHYHELTELGRQLVRAKNVNVAVREYGGKVVFLYRIIDGGADHSYGIQVAKLAGLPPTVIKRARAILESLESGNTAALGLPDQLDLFAPRSRDAKSENKPKPESNPITEALQGIDADALSPREAHELLYRLITLLESQDGA